MPRAEKEERVKALTQKLTHSEGALLTEFRGIKVHEIQELRRQLRDAGTEFRVVKNSLGRLAVKDAGMDDLLPFF
jgi:large subunit ribosomal protein L10